MRPGRSPSMQQLVHLASPPVALTFLRPRAGEGGEGYGRLRSSAALRLDRLCPGDVAGVAGWAAAVERLRQLERAHGSNGGNGGGGAAELRHQMEQRLDEQRRVLRRLAQSIQDADRELQVVAMALRAGSGNGGANSSSSSGRRASASGTEPGLREWCQRRLQRQVLQHKRPFRFNPPPADGGVDGDMRVPFFRPGRARGGDGSIRSSSGSSERTQAGGSERTPAGSPDAARSLGGGGSDAELREFLGRIDEFRGAAQRLFPENQALDRMLGELRDECQRRADYMARVSAQHAWMGPAPADGAPRRPRGARALAAEQQQQQQPAGRRESRSTLGADSSSDGSSAPPSPPPAIQRNFSFEAPEPAAAAAATGRRRKTVPQSVLLSTMPAAAEPRAGLTSPPGTRASIVAAGSLRQRTSSIDGAGRPLSALMQAPGGTARLSQSHNQTHSHSHSHSHTQTHSNGQQPHSQAKGAEYLAHVRVGGSRVEVAVAPGLQASLVSMQLATALGLAVGRVPGNARVWSSSGGKSWQVVGEVVGVPFACGNTTFTHTFKVVPGSAATNDLPRDIVLGNDFCVGNKGRIRDNRLHLERLCMNISVPVRPLGAAA
ncbi:hypothetical protein H4R18_004694 [Coemansia javaensis]|uniref:Uncharacterized protein n=1 Tax=Coemansia javaensis TaxID=2761396 RepID=A0A9W8LFX2_9FUNG|nr:hypothetical protein H4R18_004694 [Coemansia javaensis]